VAVSRSSEAATEAALAAKDPGAAGDAPIIVTGTIAFSQDDAGGLTQHTYEQAIAYGGEVELDGRYLHGFRIDPPIELGITGPLPLYSLWIEAIREPLVPMLNAQLSLIGSSGLPLQSVPLRFHDRSEAPKAPPSSEATPPDCCAHTCVWPPDLHLAPGPDHLRSRGVPRLRRRAPRAATIGAPRAGATIRLTVNAADPFSPLETTLAHDWANEDLRTWVGVCEDLQFIQDTTHVSFPIPAEMTYADAVQIRQVARLLRGEAVRIGTGPLTWNLKHTIAPLLDSFATGQRLVLARELTFTLGGWAVELGTCVDYCIITGASNLAQARKDVEADRSATLRLDLPRGEGVMRQLLPHVPASWLPPALRVDPWACPTGSWPGVTPGDGRFRRPVRTARRPGSGAALRVRRHATVHGPL
jgi:hypothetical protein